MLRLLEEPALIQQELDRRLAAAQAADPKRTRTQAVERDLARVGKTIERLLTAYQEDLVSLDQLRERMPLLRQREQTLRQELNALVEQTRDRAAHLRLAETLSAFLTRLRASAETLDIVERQRIVRLLVKEVLVSDDALVIPPLYSPFPRDRHQRVPDPMAESATSPTPQVTFCVQGVTPHSSGNLTPWPVAPLDVDALVLRMLDPGRSARRRSRV